MYRILTERRSNLSRILDEYFDGYTMYDARGRWQRKNEASAVIEVERTSIAKVRRAAMAIKKANRQQAVLIQRLASKPELV
jgi:hypothetical protein